MQRAKLFAALLVPVALAGSGCLTRSVYERVSAEQGTEVRLRSLKKGTQLIEQGYEHPATIAPVRIAHILSRIDIRKDDERLAAIPTELLYRIADGLARGLAEADENQQIVVQSVRTDRRFVLFTRSYLTSFVAYRRDGRLYVHLDHSDWELPPRYEERLPEPHVGKPSGKFRVLPGHAMTVVDEQSVAVDWRDPVFAKPTRTRITPGGRVVRRTILMESPEEEGESGEGAQEAEPEPVIPADLSPEALRRLADLEDARRRGDVSEAEYGRQRREILSGEAAAE